jgi:hypothetical protein
VIQLEATIRSAHASFQSGLISDETSLLAAFSTEHYPMHQPDLYIKMVNQPTLGSKTGFTAFVGSTVLADRILPLVTICRILLMCS